MKLIITLMAAMAITAQAKIIEVEDGESFVGFYKLNETKSKNYEFECDGFNAQSTSDLPLFNRGVVQVKNAPFYQGLEVVTFVGKSGQGEKKVQSFNKTLIGPTEDINYVDSEKIVYTARQSKATGDLKLVTERVLQVTMINGDQALVYTEIIEAGSSFEVADKAMEEAKQNGDYDTLCVYEPFEFTTN